MNLRLETVSKRYSSLRGTTDALSDVNLEIKDGEFFVILGPSGCGKSTLLNLIAGLERPTGGSIFFGERAVCTAARGFCLEPGERNVAMVFQNYALYPHLNAYGNIAFPLKTRRTPAEETDRLVREAADRVGIGHLLAARPKELSGGERQRVAIARAIVRKPNVFLLDEPLSNLDARLRLSTRSSLKTLQRNLGITTVYVTHDQTEAMSLGDRIAVMRDGRVEQVDAPQALYDKPATPFVAGFVGSPPMNLFQGLLVVESGGAFLEIEGSDARLPLGGRTIPPETAGRPITVGVRPEDVSVVPTQEEGGWVGTVEACEWLGRESVFRVRQGPLVITVLAREGHPAEGASVTLKLDPNKFHLFDPGGRV